MHLYFAEGIDTKYDLSNSAVSNDLRCVIGHFSELIFFSQLVSARKYVVSYRIFNIDPC